MITSKQVVDALIAWQRASRQAIEASRFAHAGNQEQLAVFWAEEEAALDHYNEVYNAFWTQGATRSEEAPQNHA